MVGKIQGDRAYESLSSMPTSTEEALSKAASFRTLKKTFQVWRQLDDDSVWQVQNSQESQSWAGHLLCSQGGPAKREDRHPRSQNQALAGMEVTTGKVLRISNVSGQCYLVYDPWDPVPWDFNRYLFPSLQPLPKNKNFF